MRAPGPNPSTPIRHRKVRSSVRSVMEMPPLILIHPERLPELRVHKVDAEVLGCGGATRFQLREAVGQDGLFLRDEFVERLVDARIEWRRLVVLAASCAASSFALLRCAFRPRPATARTNCCRRWPSDRTRSGNSPACGRSRDSGSAPGPTSRMASIAWPFSERSTPSANFCCMPSWSMSIMNFS